jgi:hypothetical protein
VVSGACGWHVVREIFSEREILPTHPEVHG